MTDGTASVADVERTAIDAGIRRMAAIDAEARRARRSALIVLHAPYGGGHETLVREWRRYLMQERETLLEGRTEPDGATYRPLREIVARWVRTVEDLGLLDEPLRERLGRVGPSLGLASAAAGAVPRAAGQTPTQLQYFEDLGVLFVELARRVPATVLVHDLDRADSTTLAALRYLIENVFTDPVERFAPAGEWRDSFCGTVVVTVTDRSDAVDALRDAIADRENVHFIDLRAVEEELVRAWLNDDEVVERLMLASGGSVDNLRDLFEALPRRVEDLYARRMDRVGRAERRVLDALAVLGQPVKPDFLLRVADTGDDVPSLSELADLRLIDRQVSRGELLVDFPAPDNRAIVYDAIPAARREVLHGRIAALLEERARLGEPVDLELVAHHYLRSNVSDKAVRYAIDAAERLHISFAYQRAREVLQALLDRLDDDDAARVDVLDRLVELHRVLGDHAGAIEAIGALLEVAPEARCADILRRRADVYLEMGTYDEARDDVARAREVLGDDSLLALQLTSVEAEAHYGQGEYEEALTAALDAIGRVNPDDAEQDRVAVRLTNTVGKVQLFRGDYDEAQDCFEDNRARAQRLGLQYEEVRALFNLGTIALQRRDYDDAERVFEECMKFSADATNPVTRSFLTLNLGVIYHKTLRYPEALDSYLGSLALFQRSRNDLQYAVTAMNLGSLYATLGDEDKARELLGRAIEVTSRRDIRYFHGRALYVLGTLELESGHHEAAARALGEAAELLGRTGSTFADRIRLGLARAAHGMQHRELRDEHLESIEAGDETPEAREVAADAALYRGWFRLVDGDAAGAVDSLRDALLRFERDELHERVWRARGYLAVARARTDAMAEAHNLARAAADLIRHIASPLPEALRAMYLEAPARRAVFDALAALEAGRVPGAGTAEDEAPLEPTAEEHRRWRARYDHIVGEDKRLIQIFRMVDRISDSDSTVLLQGESGTGKELVAEAIHRNSARSTGPFVKVNCAAFVETLLLSELFGHERGAFTGAMARKKGRFELAHGGTLFLDEIGDISPNTQVALLRVLQERSFERVGGGEPVDTDVRLICATNRNLEEMVRQGTFRLDLYYRLKGVVIELPPLRERRADIPRLVEHFCREFAAEGRRPRRFSRDAMEHLVRYSWPGNIRELENFVRSMLLFVDGDRVELANVRQFEDFFADGQFLDTPPAFFVDYATPTSTGDIAPVAPPPEPAQPPVDEAPAQGGAADEALDRSDHPEQAIAAWALQKGVGLQDLKRALEVELIRQALVESGGNITHAARLLDMKRPRLSQIINGTPELEALRAELTA